MSYISPVHYNSVHTLAERDMVSRNAHTAYKSASLGTALDHRKAPPSVPTTKSLG